VESRPLFARFANRTSEAAGSPKAFVVAVVAIAAWAVLGPVFHWSDSWQLVVNTSTTIVTFLMVFLVQATQNRESRALHLKLDELIRVQKRARNIFADLEHATDEEIAQLEAEFRKIRARAEARGMTKGAQGAQEAH
jgi:low affinity Fe/Cu permease